MDAATIAAVDGIVARLRKAGWKEREAIKDELKALAESAAAAGPTAGAGMREHLDTVKKDLSLELKWEIDEVIEAITPPPEPPPEPPKPAEEPPKKGLTQSDLTLIYDDPRGLMLYKTKVAPERWFATQVDPRTGQPQTFELHPQEITQIRQQLAGSPYWLLGAGGAPAAPAASPLAPGPAKK